MKTLNPEQNARILTRDVQVCDVIAAASAATAPARSAACSDAIISAVDCSRCSISITRDTGKRRFGLVGDDSSAAAALALTAQVALVLSC